MGKNWGRLCSKRILSLPHPIYFWQTDTWVCMCVKLCQGAGVEVLISELKLCDSSLMMTSFAEQLTVTLPKHAERDLIGGESSSNPPSCEVSRYNEVYFLSVYLTQPEMNIVLHESHIAWQFFPVRPPQSHPSCIPPGWLWIIVWGHSFMDTDLLC